MNVAEEAVEFAQSIAEAQQLLERVQALLQRAKSKCHGDIYEHANVICMRTYELKVRAEWLRLAMLGAIDPRGADEGAGTPRETPDRRSSLDRRVAGMRRQILALTPKD